MLLFSNELLVYKINLIIAAKMFVNRETYVQEVDTKVNGEGCELTYSNDESDLLFYSPTSFFY